MKFEMDGLDKLMADFDGVADGTEEMVYEMLEEAGDVVVDAQKKTASSMLKGPYSKGVVANAIKKGKIDNTANGKVLNIVFEGTRYISKGAKGTRIAEIAFVNEFGKTNQQARPFIETANNQSADAMAKAAADVQDRHLKKRGL